MCRRFRNTSRVFQISLEAVIGISYAIAAAATLFLVGVAPGGHMHIQHILSGSLLWTCWRQIITSLIVFSLIGLAFYLTAAILASLCGLVFAYYLDFSIGPAIAMFLGCELVITSFMARFWPEILNLQNKQTK